MMNLPLKVMACFTALAVNIAASAWAQPRSSLEKSISIERGSDATDVDLSHHMGKLQLTAELNGHAAEFIFDTGSPTMISKELAAELGLEITGTNTGRDANGKAVTTQIAIVDRLQIGDTAFRSVPVLVHDFRSIDPKGCFIANGVIGSEIFPGSAWRIDAERQKLQIAASAASLPKPVAGTGVIAAKLHDFGYPHAPIFDYSIGALKDRGLLDTGNSDTLTLFERVAESPEARAATNPSSVGRGFGSHGMSAGGLGNMMDLARFEIDDFRLDTQHLGTLSATTRSAPPSLLGLGVLKTHSVILDYNGEQLLLEPRANPAKMSPPIDFGLMVIDGIVRVTQIFKDTQAEAAGLRLGDAVTAIDGRAVSSMSAPCALERWLIEDRPASAASRITVVREGKTVTLKLAP